MQQVLQNLSNGDIQVADLPCPRVQPGGLLIKSRVSLISAGTERMLVEFGKANIIQKARSQPDKVKMVLDKIKTDGLFPTIEAIQSKLDVPLAPGYCNVGTVVEVGRGVHNFQVGDRVVSNGKHAEFVCVPQNLCAKIPDEVSDETAAFTILGAIALQGIRLVAPTFGEIVVVTGLGLIGLIAAQLLKANGCQVIGVDLDHAKLKLATDLGINAFEPSQVARFENKVDAVLLTASTSSSEPVSQAAKMCRKRGRIVLVGVTGLELSRADFYEKELSFQVSCSYGPGRYDRNYEEKGQDYPIGFVRWTEQRNFEAVLNAFRNRSVNVQSLISHRFDVHRANEAYDCLSTSTSLGILIEYPVESSKPFSGLANTIRLRDKLDLLPRQPIVGVIGAGNYGGRVLIPAFQKAGAFMHTIASGTGVTAYHFGKKIGFKEATTNSRYIVEHPEINCVVVATRHDSHADLVCQALGAGKHVFVEKPLALKNEELDAIELAYRKANNLLMVGFNRRFAPHVVKIKELLRTVAETKSIVVTINAGAIPREHWTQDNEIGGGRIIGEACHFIDLLRCLVGESIVDSKIIQMGKEQDTVSFTLSFMDGSVGTVHYFANGHKSFPKERLEIFCAGRILQLDNFRRLKAYGWPQFQRMNLWRQDKGQSACVKSFVDSVHHAKEAPISFAELIEVSRTSIQLAEYV